MLNVKKGKIFLAVVLFLGAGMVASAVEPVPVYHCKKVGKGIKIDGVIGEEWKGAEVVNFVDVESGAVPRYKTEARMLWDERYFYVSFICFDPDAWAFYKAKDSPLWEEELAEIMIDCDGDGERYPEIEINANNCVSDFFNLRLGAGTTWQRNSLWDIKGLKSAVNVKGTLNNYFDVDEYWSVELAIPWETFIIAKAKNLPPKNGDEWRINLYRYERPLDAGLMLTAFSPTYAYNFHVFDRFAKVIFEE